MDHVLESGDNIHTNKMGRVMYSEYFLIIKHNKYLILSFMRFKKLTPEKYIEKLQSINVWDRSVMRHEYNIYYI